MKAWLFARLREHFQRRDRLRLVIDYRRKHLESLVRQGEEEAGKIAQEYREAGAQQEQEYAETAAAQSNRERRAPVRWFRFIRPSGRRRGALDRRASVRWVRFIAERWPAGSRGFQAPDYPRTGSRRGATFATHAQIARGGQASLRDARCSRGHTGA